MRKPTRKEVERGARSLRRHVEKGRKEVMFFGDSIAELADVYEGYLTFLDENERLQRKLDIQTAELCDWRASNPSVRTPAQFEELERENERLKAVVKAAQKLREAGALDLNAWAVMVEALMGVRSENTSRV